MRREAEKGVISPIVGSSVISSSSRCLLIFLYMLEHLTQEKKNPIDSFLKLRSPYLQSYPLFLSVSHRSGWIFVVYLKLLSSGNIKMTETALPNEEAGCGPHVHTSCTAH